MTALAILFEFRYAFFQGSLVTFALLGISSTAGTCLGVFLYTLRLYVSEYAKKIVDSVAFVLSTVPALVILFWFYSTPIPRGVSPGLQ